MMWLVYLKKITSDLYTDSSALITNSLGTIKYHMEITWLNQEKHGKNQETYLHLLFIILINPFTAVNRYIHFG